MAMDKNKKQILFYAIFAAIQGGIKILEVYNTNFSVDMKKDNTPVILADKRSRNNLRLLWIHINSAMKYFNKWGCFIDKERKSIWVV